MPTLASDARLLNCLASLEAQTGPEVQVVVVDNSGCGAIHRLGAAKHAFRLIENQSNLGFGAAVNQGFRRFPAPYMAVLNDDAVARPDCLARLVDALESDPAAGMAAPRITLAGTELMDSAGMLIARDGSSKQRGHLEPAALHDEPGEVLLPSGCAALYRQAMLEEIGLFDEDFFLYCEDTDLGLRARWAGWRCLYVPGARVEHHYSRSAGPASERKAWYVERNRLRLAVRCLPLSWLLASPFASAMRYLWHIVTMFRGQGKAAEFRRAGGGGLRLPWLVVKAHLSLLAALPKLLRQRSAIRRAARLSSADFSAVLNRHSISLRQVAEL
ncbi:MAG: glycosyltransferase family 2 protein [Candidatus Solibacter usitatus]|nr:glycosyltransferase family 2 protein [Candidatus Solibacter usitatus]